jgi:hypothetical protein
MFNQHVLPFAELIDSEKFIENDKVLPNNEINKLLYIYIIQQWKA